MMPKMGSPCCIHTSASSIVVTLPSECVGIEIDKETRLAAAELARKIAAAIWAMRWFTAKAVNVPKELTQTDVSDYDKEMQEFLPGILGDMMVVSALNEEIAGKMLPPMDKINSVDVQITEGSINLNTSPESSLKMLADTYCGMRSAPFMVNWLEQYMVLQA
jgi:hypothetical protein